MEIQINRSKCIEGCSLCFEACPYLSEEAIEKLSKDELFEFMKSSNISEEVKNRCPESAFEETHNNSSRIDPEKCTGCGECLEEANGTILMEKGRALKCDLCAGEENYRCVEACPYDALEVVHTEQEKEELKEKIGYRVEEYTELEPVKGRISEVEESENPIYLVDEENFNIQEARIVHRILNSIREKGEDIEEPEIEGEVERQCLEMNFELTENHVEKLSEYINREINGLSVLDPLIEDDELEEISIIAPGKPLYIYHMDRGWTETNLTITDPEKVKSLINKTARKLNRRITLKKPRINTNIHRGRIHGAIKPLAVTGNCMTIRKFITDKFKPKDLVENNTISKELMNLLRKTVKCDTNILIAGNTGSGKTTTLNTLLHLLPDTERIVIVEETPEVKPPQSHAIRLNTSPSLDIEMHELVTDTLRMRPDRVVVGEVRDSKEAEALLNTMLAGQGKGSIATFHGNSAEETLTRLKSLGVNPRDLEAIDLVIVQRRWIDQSTGGQEKRQVIEAATVDRGSETTVFYEREKGLQAEKLRDTKLMDKLKLSYGATEDEIISGLEV